MVTIEQKLSMFSKLLHRTMNEKFTEEMEKLRSEYAVKLQKNRDEAGREAQEILKRSAKRAETEKTEILSRIRINIKKDQMAVKEKLFSTLTVQLSDRIGSFVRSEEYGGYLAAMAEKLAEAVQSKDSLAIYMTAEDIKKYGEWLKKELCGIQPEKLTLVAANDSIIGGFIAVDPESDIRMDFSIKTLLEDNKPYMMQTLFQALEAEGSEGSGLTNGTEEIE
jgi:vacuolar-type H+-ATPase subunit E/Vma4